MTLATFFLFVAAVLQYRASRDQLMQMREQTVAMREEVKAANRVADIAADQTQAVKDSATAAMDSATAAQKAVDQNKEMIESAKIQADTSQVSARAAEESAKIAAQSFSIGERPYIATKAVEIKDFEVGSKPIVGVFFDNTGKTPGLNATMRSYSAVRAKKKLGKANYGPLASISTSVVQTGCCHRQVITAFNEGLPQEIINTLIQEVKEGRLWLYIYGIVKYDDGAGKRHALKFCRYYDIRNAGEFTYCAEHNSSN